MPSLLTLTEEMIDLMAAMDSEDFEADLCALAETLNENLEEKVDSYCSLIRNLELTAAARKSEADRIATLAKADANKAKRLKDWLQSCLTRINRRTVETALFKVRVQQNGGKAPLEITGDVPEKYLRATYIADKDAIRADIEAGNEVPNCRIAERGESLRIR